MIQKIDQELSKRLLTGLTGAAALVLLIIFGGSLGIFLMSSVLSLGMIFEFCNMTFQLHDRSEKRYFVMLLTWLVHLGHLIAPHLEYGFLIFSFLSLFAYFLMTARRHLDEKLPHHFIELMASFFGLIYLGFIPLYFKKLYDLSHGVEWTLVFLLIVWLGDSGAYFAGKKYGRKKLYPKISPKKTWEGSLGGVVAGFLITLIVKATFFKSMSWVSVLTLPVVVGVVSQVGDLCESFLKRAFHVKDSGTILPGHGGFLDRFDGVVFSLPAMYACVRMLS